MKFRTKGLLAVALVFAAAAASAQTLTLTGTVRDFNSFGTTFNGVAGHPDFEHNGGDDRGIVQSALGADGEPVYAGGTHPTVTSAASFYQWYHDDSSVNRTGSTTITLNKINATEYQYSSNSYFPIDGQLLGQNSGGHNFGFTTEFHTVFTYKNANNDQFAFSGDDDVFVFINKKLAIDIGGVHGAESASVLLNGIAASFGLTDGNDYQLDVFQAERHTTGSNFTMTTSLQLATAPVPEPETWGMLLAGLGLLGFVARRRQAKITT